MVREEAGREGFRRGKKPNLSPIVVKRKLPCINNVAYIFGNLATCREDHLFIQYKLETIAHKTSTTQKTKVPQEAWNYMITLRHSAINLKSVSKWVSREAKKEISINPVMRGGCIGEMMAAPLR